MSAEKDNPLARPHHEPLRDPETKPDLPSTAAKMNIQEHIRILSQPMLVNALGNPDTNGPRYVIDVEIRCPVCQYIQSIGAPGEDHKCGKCGINYKYTAVKGDTWLWIWRDQEKLVLET